MNLEHWPEDLPLPTEQIRYQKNRARWITSTWLPALLGILIICGESTEPMGAEHTSRFLRPLVEHIFGHMDDATWEVVHHLIRKTGHFCGYGLLSLVFLRSWYRTLRLKRPWFPPALMQFRAAGLSIASIFLVACGDEFHQTFVPGRTGLFSDAILDTVGAIIFQLITNLLLQWRRKRKAAKAAA